MSKQKIILVVCTANVCRSPMAAGLLRHRLQAAGLDGAYEVRSVGTWAVTGAPASSHAEQVMARRGIDISHHRAREVTAADILEANLILVMTEVHREALLAEFPAARGKTYLLSEMVGKRYDIADPYGSNLANYEYCAEEMSSIIDAGFERILSLADRGGQ